MQQNNLTSLNELENYYPNPNSIISMSSNGETKSVFSDNIWDMKVYQNSNGASKIIFDLSQFNKNELLVAQVEYEMKLIVYAFFNFRLSNKSRKSINTLMGDITHIKYLASLCLSFNTTLSECSNHPFILNQLKDDLVPLASSTRKKRMYVLLKLPLLGVYYKNQIFGFKLDQIQPIYSNVKSAPDDTKQTLVIPTRIYSYFIQRGIDLFSEYLSLKEDIEAWFAQISQNKNYGNAKSRSRKGMEFYETIEEHGLTEYCSKYSITDKQEFTFHLKDIQYYSYFYFLCFTGMRATEGMFCPYNAFQKKIVQNNLIYTVESYTTKQVGLKPVKALWVTSQNLMSANEVAQSICQIGLKIRGKKIIDESKTPLFYSFYHKDTECSNFYPDFATTNMEFNKCVRRLLSDLVISKTDIEEIIKIQPVYAFDPSIVEGATWPFTHHQFRRSLAVYCARSGLVSLPALKNQLKHIEVDMTAYYANGAMFAKNIFEDTDLTIDEEFIDEFNNELIEFQCDQFLEDINNQENHLFGAHGTWIEVNRNQSIGVEYLSNRKETIKRMKDGRLSYKRTPLGGCSINGTCDRLSFAHISACISCPNAVFNDRSVKALTALKVSLANTIKRFEESSPYRQQTQLEINAIEKILSKSASKEVS